MITRRGEYARYTARDGRRFIVYDSREYEPGKGRHVTLSSADATHRVFQPLYGAKLAYRFHAYDVDRALEIELLEHQLACAGFIGKHLYHSPANPR